MTPYTEIDWFSTPQPTKEQAQALHLPDGFFDPAAVFKTPDGFVMALLRVGEWPPHGEARSIKELIGYEMVSHCDPLLNAWREYKEETP